MKLRSRLIALSLCFAPALGVADDTEWLIAPYGWLPTVSVDQGFDDGSGGSGDTEVLSKLDFFVMLRMEVARGHWGAMLDYIYVSLADQTSFSPLPLVNVDIETNLDLSELELGGFYRLSTDPRGMDLLLGLRRIDVKLGLLVGPEGQQPRPLQIEPVMNDVYLGARYRLPLGERWSFSLRGDYGFGDSNGTLNLLAGIALQFNDTFGMTLGYRHFTIEFEDDVEGTTETTDISLSGPYVGALFRF